MKNTFGSNLTLTLFGESHGESIGCVLDGLAPGLPVVPEQIAAQLERRRPGDSISTARVEPDQFRILSGVCHGRTTGTPLCILIPNTQARSEDYAEIARRPRPGHADYAGYVKYHGFADPNGGGHFSGRMTAALVAGGAILLDALRLKGIELGTHIARLGGVADRRFDDCPADLALLRERAFAALDPNSASQMFAAALAAREDGDSVGGVLETAVIGLPAGLGEPWFDTLEGVLAHALFSIPGVKGVEFGDGFALCDRRGSEVNDPFRAVDGKIITTSNHNGGVNGGISNGMPLLFRCAVKPTPSISLPQETVELPGMENVTLTLRGRHDPSIVPRACPVVDCLTALVLADQLAGRCGTDWLASGR